MNEDSLFRSCEIGDVCYVTDGAHAKVARQASGVLYLTSKNIGQGELLLKDVSFITREDYNALFLVSGKAQRRPRPGDVLIGIIGTFGNAYLYRPGDEFGISSAVAIIRPDPAKLLPEYLYYLVASESFRASHSAYKAGSVQGYTNIPTLKRLPLRLPSLGDQQAIADLLSVLDRAFRNCQSSANTLEAIARAIFKSWFVDFDPVRAKAEGREPEGMDAATAALFPASFGVSEHVELPDGWRATKLGAEADRHGGRIQTGPFGSQLHASDYTVEGIPVVMPQDLSNRRVSTIRVARIKESDAVRLSRHRLEVGDIIYSRRGDVERHAQISTREAGWLCGTGCLLVRMGPRWPSPTFISLALDRPEARAWINRHAIGATLPNLNTGILSDVPLIVPSETLLRAFTALVDPMEQLISENNAKSQTLSMLRDTLLPRLISGKLRVPQAEKLVEAVL